MKRFALAVLVSTVLVAPAVSAQVASTPDTTIGDNQTTGDGGVDRGVGGSEYGGTGNAGTDTDSEGGGAPIGVIGIAGLIGFLGIFGRLRARGRAGAGVRADRAA